MHAGVAADQHAIVDGAPGRRTANGHVGARACIHANSHNPPHDTLYSLCSNSYTHRSVRYLNGYAAQYANVRCFHSCACSNRHAVERYSTDEPAH